MVNSASEACPQRRTQSGGQARRFDRRAAVWSTCRCGRSRGRPPRRRRDRRTRRAPGTLLRRTLPRAHASRGRGLSHHVEGCSCPVRRPGGDGVGALLEIAAVRGEQPEPAAQLANLLHTGMCEQFCEHADHLQGLARRGHPNLATSGPPSVGCHSAGDTRPPARDHRASGRRDDTASRASRRVPAGRHGPQHHRCCAPARPLAGLGRCAARASLAVRDTSPYASTMAGATSSKAGNGNDRAADTTPAGRQRVQFSLWDGGVTEALNRGQARSMSRA